MTKEEKLLYAIGEIDDELIMEADAPAPKNITAFPMNKRWKKAMLTAACFLLCIGVWASVGGLFRMGSSSTGMASNAKPAAPAEALIPEAAEEECDEIVAETECTTEEGAETPMEAPAAKAEEANPETSGAVKCPVGEDEVFYINYQAPLLPLDVSGDNDGIRAERQLTIDAAAQYDESNTVEAVDEYLLKNTTNVDKTFTLEYHYSANFRTAESASMKVDGSADGQSLEASLSYNGFEDDGMNIHHFSNWYDLMERFPTEFSSVDDHVSLYANEPVVVYELYDAEIPSDAPDAACIAVEFECDEDTFIWNNNFNGMSVDGNNRIYDVFAKEFTRREEMSKSLWVFGGQELRNIQIKGYTNGACEVEYDGVTAKLRSYQTTLKEAVSQSVWQYAEANDIVLERVDEETLANAVLAYLKYSPLGAEPQPRYDYLSSWEVNSDVLGVDRIFTIEQTVTIPANSSIHVKVELEKRPNWAFESAQSCIDVAPSLGSELDFDSIVIDLVKSDVLDVLSGNLTEGETELDTETERWYAIYKEAELCGLPLNE